VGGSWFGGVKKKFGGGGKFVKTRGNIKSGGNSSSLWWEESSPKRLPGKRRVFVKEGCGEMGGKGVIWGKTNGWTRYKVRRKKIIEYQSVGRPLSGLDSLDKNAARGRPEWKKRGGG